MMTWSANGQSRLARLLWIAPVTLLAIFAFLFAFSVGPFKRTIFDCPIRVALHAQPPEPPLMSPTAPRARTVTPEQLMSGQVTGLEFDDVAGTVPRILHQSWKTAELPQRFRDWSDTWRRLHPSWLHVLWTDADNGELVDRYYANYSDVYHSLPREIYRVDMVRNMYMHRFGGVYIDADLEAIRPIDPLLKPPLPNLHDSAFVARMGHDVAYRNSIPNAFLASTPRHPFWLEPLSYVREHASQLNADDLPTVLLGGESYGPEELTGPVPLWRAATAYVQHRQTAMSAMTILDPSTIFPYDHHNLTSYAYCVCSAQSVSLDPPRCKALFPTAYAISYWSQSWGVVNWANLTGVAHRSASTIWILLMIVISTVSLAILYWRLQASKRSHHGQGDLPRFELQGLLQDDNVAGPPSPRLSPGGYPSPPKKSRHSSD